MGKKKAVKTNNPDALKEAGNKAFAQKKYTEAVKQYTMAIEISQETPNHIYFANRANAYLEMGLFEECIADCNQAM
jgi:tetratricopeptide (TPR) repeat protein